LTLRSDLTIEPGGADPDLGDDIVVPFQVPALGVRGRLVRLEPMVTDILSRHDYPEPVSRLLAEAVALTAMLGTALKFEGRFILQTKTDGPVDILVADLTTPGAIRGYAHFDRDKVERAVTEGSAAGSAAMLGDGHLALTIDQGAGMERYQGVVPLEATSLADAANHYFQQSEQIPTRVHLAAGLMVTAGSAGTSTRWRAGGLMVQHLPDSATAQRHDDEMPGGMFGVGGEGDGENWGRAEILASTVRDHELLDPGLSPLRLLYRLFHEDGVRAAEPRTITRHCSCSRQSVETMLRQFPADDQADMIKNGMIEVTCEFCNSVYRFAAGELGLG